MFRSNHIIRFLSGFLLLVFVIGITPKKFLHDMFAKHTDVTSKLKNDKPFQLTTSGYNCNCDNLVAESTFTHDLQVFSLPLFTSFFNYISRDISFSSICKIYSPLRGPPEKV